MSATNGYNADRLETLNPYSHDAVHVVVGTPPADRARLAWEPRSRVADYRTLFAFYTDVVENTDFALRQDPQAHDRMLRDGQIFAALRIRQLAVAARDLQFTPSDRKDGESRRYCDLMRGVWLNMERGQQSLLNMLDSLSRGVSLQEIEWKFDPTLLSWCPRRMWPVHPSRIAFDTRNNLLLRTPYDVYYGEHLAPLTYVLHTTDPEPGDWNKPEEEGRVVWGHGLLDRLYPWWLWKSILIRFMLRSCERAASGSFIWKYPYRDTAALNAAQGAASLFDHSSQIFYPSDAGWDVELLAADGNTPEAIRKTIEYIDGEMTKAILGSTLILDSAGASGSYAMAETHERTTFGRIVAFDEASLLSTLRLQFMKYVFQMNSWPLEKMPNINFRVGPRWSLTEVVNAVVKLSQQGYPVAFETISEETGIRQAGENETVLTVHQTTGEVKMTVGPGGPNVELSMEQSAGDPKVVEGKSGYSAKTQVSVPDVTTTDDSVRKYSMKQAATSGLAGPLAMIAAAAQELHPVILRYRKEGEGVREYVIEPYSLRRSKGAGRTFLFAVDIREGKTKSFAADEIVSVDVLDALRYEARYPVEF